jgi:SPP1 gp7 family putative phage head morphogenesis protein
MSATQFIIDASTRHQVFLQRYGGGQSKEAQVVLDRIRRKINARILSEPTQFQAQRLSIVQADIDSIYQAGFQDLTSTVETGAMQLAQQEAEFSAELYGKTTTISWALPSERSLLAAVESAPMSAPGGRGITIDEALAQYGDVKSKEILQAIDDGVVLGDTSQQIASSVNSLMTHRQRNQLDTLVRTVTNHASSVARNAVYEANGDIIEGYRFIATLDGRTTFICASIDNEEIYQPGLGPMPPLHWGCRSTTIPVVKDHFSIAKGMEGERAAKGGPVGSKTTYGGWLKTQPKEFIDEALGVGRSKLFRSGKLKIKQFVDPTGRVYTLNELRSMNPFAFQEQ